MDSGKCQHSVQACPLFRQGLCTKIHSSVTDSSQPQIQSLPAGPYYGGFNPRADNQNPQKWMYKKVDLVAQPLKPIAAPVESLNLGGLRSNVPNVDPYVPKRLAQPLSGGAPQNSYQELSGSQPARNMYRGSQLQSNPEFKQKKMENVYRPSHMQGANKYTTKNEEHKFSQKKNYLQKDREEVKESYPARRDFGSSQPDKNLQRTNPEPGNIMIELQETLAKLLQNSNPSIEIETQIEQILQIIDSQKGDSKPNQFKLESSEKPNWKSKRECKFGKTCRQLRQGTCSFKHSQDDVSDALAQPRIPMRDRAFKQQSQEEDKQSRQSSKESNIARNDPQSIIGAANPQPPAALGVRHREERKAAQREPQRGQPQREEGKAAFQRDNKQQPHGFLSYNFLKELLDIKDIDQLKTRVQNLPGTLTEKINGTKMEKQIPLLMLQLIQRFLENKTSDMCRRFVTSFVDSNFFINLPGYLNSRSGDLRCPLYERQSICFSCIAVLHSLLDMYPSRFDHFKSSVSAVNSETDLVLMRLQMQQLACERDEEKIKKLDEEKRSLMQKFCEIGIEAENDKKRREEEKKSSLRRNRPGDIRVDEYKIQPSDDFKEVEILPGEMELTNPQRLIRKMPEEGDLQNNHNYLDLLFRLLHDDSIHDLRKGIVLMRGLENAPNQQGINVRRQLKEQSAVKYYSQMFISNLEIIDGARCIQMRLSVDKKRFVDWRISKKLLPGSLVVLSADKFQNLFVGVLKNADAKQRNDTHKKYGFISVNVEILKSTEDINSTSDFFFRHEKSNFQMIESAAYFESYCHVLRQLKEMDAWPALPMQDFIVHGKSQDIAQPDYLKSLFEEKKDEVAQMIQSMNLDETQLAAVNHSLANNLTLIQGPPGTGKTYIGVQIVKMLIHFTSYWHSKGPILVVCYTNHALYQFLGFIKAFTTQIIKVGGKREEGFEQFSLHDQLRECNMGRGFGKVYREIKEVEAEIKKIQMEMQKYEFKLVNSLIGEDQSENVQQILRSLKHQFRWYLEDALEQCLELGDTRDLIEERFTQLRSNTQDNIIVLLWLGIIDIRKLIRFMITDEEKKGHIRRLDNQIQGCQLEQQNIQRTIDRLANELGQKDSYIRKLRTYIDGEEHKGQQVKMNMSKDQAKQKLEYEEYQWNMMNGQILDCQMQQQDLQQEIDDLQDQINQLQRADMQAQAIALMQGLQLDNHDVIEADQREMDYDDYRFLDNNTFNSLLDVLSTLFSPELVNEMFLEAESIHDCIAMASNHEANELEFLELIDKVDNELDIFNEGTLSLAQRWQINNYVMSSLYHKRIDHLDKCIERYKESFRIKKEIEAGVASELIKKQHIIAMTTTGRAKYSEMLAKVNFPIVIVEEAAEVFEAHILTALSGRTEHVILIGDHEQLRPSPAVHELDIQYNLSMSMFERLIKNKVTHTTLGTQRRMRPEIAKIMSYIYPELQNHESVQKYPDVKGVGKNLFFFNHQWKEETNQFMMSKLNIKEAQMVVRFAWYLIQQKQYEGKQITILTLYAGQLLRIKSMIKENPTYKDPMWPIRVVNVDNYQGEENDIILLSLVRSNNEGQIGFLKTSNRVCVALSRAKHGLYIFGNSQCLIGSKKLKLWEKVITYLKDNDHFGDFIPLKCQNHSDICEVKCLDDFKLVPEGGCNRKCDMRLDCGHSCESICHPYVRKPVEDPTGHNDRKCLKICVRPLDCGHECKQQCFKCKDSSQPCITEIEKEMKPCGHIMQIMCHEKDVRVKCEKPCEKVLLCGHLCKKWCGEDCSKFKCKITVERELPCGHKIEMDCSRNLMPGDCYKKCEQILPCGHPCPNKCGECSVSAEHGQCKKKCTRMNICGHQCELNCSQNCAPCSKPCQTFCPHSNCSKLCKSECVLCVEECENYCPHSKCSKKCSEPCYREPCNLPCQKEIKECGHQCIGLCGEICPSVCLVCQPDHETFEIYFGFEQEEGARFIQLECSHAFEVQGLDHWMNMTQQTTSEDDPTAVKYKECPRCKRFIMKCPRYMTQVNQTLNDINAIKLRVLERESLYQRELDGLHQDIEDLISKTNSFDTSAGYFKICRTINEKVKRLFANARKTRDTNLVNEVIHLLRYSGDLLTLAKVDQYHGQSLTMQQSQKIKQIFSVALKLDGLTDKRKKELSQLAQDLTAQFGMEDELKFIIDAIGLSRGHWNKCPNGHYYVISDCGGAMETSQCPDCKAVIGGKDHVLAAGNRHAAELGGRPAWDPNGFNAQVARGEVDLRRIE